MNKPIIIDPKIKDLKTIKKEYCPYKVIDTYKEQLEDLFLIRNPHYKFNKNYQDDFEKFVNSQAIDGSLEKCGSWVYFPWNNILVHYLSDPDHQEVRTARNRNLLTEEEQKKFYKLRVGVAGLSVGSHGALTTVVMGGAKLIKLADPDTISPTNLNRMRFDFLDIGVNKTEKVSHYIYQLNPYADVYSYTSGITDENINDFLEDIDVLVEELDDIEVKVKMREMAKIRKIPVVMVTDNGHNVIVDVERFDTNPDLPVFYGSLDGFNLREIKTNPAKMFEAMAKIIDVSLVPPRVLNSVLEVGRTLYSWPQLASAATLSGVVIAYLLKRIALNEPIKEGKYEINLDEILDPNYETDKIIRDEELKKFLKAISVK